MRKRQPPKIVIQPAQSRVANPFAAPYAVRPIVPAQTAPAASPMRLQEPPTEPLPFNVQQRLQSLLSLLTSATPLPSQIPGEGGVSARDKWIGSLKELAEAPPAPTDIDVQLAQAAAQASAYKQLPAYTTFQLPSLPELPQVPRLPTVHPPPEYSPTEQHNIARYAAAIFGLIRPAYAGSFAAAALKGTAERQQEEFERKRQYWHDLTTAEQQALQNNMSLYNANLSRTVQDYNMRLNRATAEEQHQANKLAAERQMLEKQEVAQGLQELAKRAALASSAKQRAQAAGDIAEALDQEDRENKERIARVLPALISLQATLSNIPVRQETNRIRREQLAISERRLFSDIHDRLVRQNLSTERLKLAQKQLELLESASERQDVETILANQEVYVTAETFGRMRAAYHAYMQAREDEQHWAKELRDYQDNEHARKNLSAATVKTATALGQYIRALNVFTKELASNIKQGKPVIGGPRTPPPPTRSSRRSASADLFEQISRWPNLPGSYILPPRR